MHHHTGMNIARHDHHKLFSLVTAESRNKPYSLKIQCYIVGEIVSNFQAITNKCTAIIKQNTTYRTIIKLGKIKERLDGNLIGENPAVAAGRIASRPTGDKTRITTLRYGPITKFYLESLDLRVLSF